jgi:hypothetical protein
MDAFACAIICIALWSTWLMVLALGRIEAAFPFAWALALALALATLFLRARLWAGVPLVDSRRFRGRDEGVDV